MAKLSVARAVAIAARHGLGASRHGKVLRIAGGRKEEKFVPIEDGKIVDSLFYDAASTLLAAGEDESVRLNMRDELMAPEHP